MCVYRYMLSVCVCIYIYVCVYTLNHVFGYTRAVREGRVQTEGETEEGVCVYIDIC